MKFKRIGNDDTKTKEQAKRGDNNKDKRKGIKVDVTETPAENVKQEASASFISSQSAVETEINAQEPPVETPQSLAETRITVLICR